MAHIALHPHTTTQKIHITDPQRGRLPIPQARRAQQGDEVAHVPALVHERLQLRRSQVHLHTGVLRRQFHPTGRVRRKHPILHGQVQYLREHHVAVAHRRRRRRRIGRLWVFAGRVLLDRAEPHLHFGLADRLNLPVALHRLDVDTPL